jgi:hypothetical protein
MSRVVRVTPRRVSLAVACALLTAVSLTPAGATVLCVSGAGVVLEPAVGASRQCPDACSPSAAGDGISAAQHACRDILVPQGALPGDGMTVGPASAATPVVWSPPLRDARATAPDCVTRTQPRDQPRQRSVVLLL